MSLAAALVREARWHAQQRQQAATVARRAEEARRAACHAEGLREWCRTVKPRPRGPGED